MADNINVGIRIAGDSSGFVKAARASQTELDKLNRGFRDNSKSAKQFGDTTRQIGSQLTLFRNIAAGVGLSLGFGQAISEIRGFEKEMSQVRAISGATAKDMELLTKRARELGSTTSFSAAEAAQGMTLLAQAGLSADQSLAAIGETLSLAAAGGLSLAESADVATNTLSQFGLSADQAGRVADVLAQSAASANTTVSQMGVAMRQVGPVANSLGLDLETTAAAISTLSNSGIKGEQAGTGLRAVLASLIDPSKEAAEVIDRLGVNVSDLSDPGAVFEQFQKAGLTAKDAVKIFGREAAAAGLILAGASDDVATLTEKLNNAEGAAARMAKEVQDNLDGDIKTLSSSISELILQTGDKGLTGALRSGTQALTAMVRAASGATSFAELREELGLMLDITSLVAVAIGGRLVASLATAATGMGAATTAATVLRGALTLLGGPVGIAVTAAGALAILATRESETEKAAREAKGAHEELKKALDLVEKSTGKAREAAISHAISLRDQKIETLNTTEAQLKLVEAQIKGVESLATWEKLKGAGDTGPIKAEAAALRAEVEKLQSGIDELRNSSSLLTITVEGASSEMGHLDDRAAAVLKTMQKNTKATDENGKATSKAAVETDKFADSFQSLLESLDPAVRAEREFQERTDLLNRALKEGKLTLAEYNKFLGLTFEEYNNAAGGAEEVAKAIDKSTDAAVTFAEQANPFRESWTRTLDDVSRAISDGLVDGFKDAADTVKSIFSSLLRSLVNAAIRSKILIPMGLAPGPAMASGFGGGGFNPGSLFGLSGGATTKGASPISPMAAGGLPGGGASSLPFSGNLGFLNNSSFVSNPLASGIGGFAGNLGANALLGGNRGAGANIGGTIGAIGGSFLPLPPGVGTAVGGFVGNFLGGLFGGGKSDMAQGGVLNLATGSRDLAGQTGKKFSQENADARTAVLDQAQQFSQTLAQIAGEAIQGSINIVIGSRDGLRLKTEGTVRNFGDDMDALLGGVFDSIVKQSGIFSGKLEDMVINFRGSNEQLAQFATSLATIQRYTKTDPFADFTEALLSGTRTLYQQALVSRRELIDLARSFDGSLDAANELANATQNRYQIELALLQQIDSVARGISSSFADTKEQIIQATLSQEQLYDRLSTRAEDLARQMQTAIDPQVIGELAAQINTLTGRAFGLLGEEQKQSSQSGFLDFLSGVENLAGQRLDMSRQSIAVDRNAGLSGTVASELSKVIGGFGAQQQRLLNEQERAAIAQREAAEAARRAAEAQERAALARETYYSGMGGR